MELSDFLSKELLDFCGDTRDDEIDQQFSQAHERENTTPVLTLALTTTTAASPTDNDIHDDLENS